MVGLGRPAMAFYPDRELNGDPTNWWGPNVPAVRGMLESWASSSVRTVTRLPNAGLPRRARGLPSRCAGKTPCRSLSGRTARYFTRTKPATARPGTRTAVKKKSPTSHVLKRRRAFGSSPTDRSVSGGRCRVMSTRILSLVVVETVVVDPEEELSRGRHRNRHAAADGERLAVGADAADQRAREHVGQWGVRRLAARLGAERVWRCRSRRCSTALHRSR